jgi:transcription elongation GreA/GreB family factor
LATIASNRLQSIEQHWTGLEAQLSSLRAFGHIESETWLLADDRAASGCQRTAIRLDTAMQSRERLFAWAQYNHHRSLCMKAKLGDFVELLEELQVPAASVVDAFIYRFNGSIAESLFRQNPRLNRFSATKHNSVRRDFAELDTQLIALRGRQVGSKSIKAARPPTGNAGVRVGDKTEMNLLELLVQQTRPRVTVRSMLERAGEAIRELKPCFMMGSQAVAQFLHQTPGAFDIVIMDEASQMRPEEAIGAIARGRQLVVVGDPKQLPPTSFFSRAQVDDDSQPQMAAVDAESILDVASSHFRPIRSLRWHYRSQHESLIAFSNQKFYQGKLVVFPSPFPRSHGLGVRSHYVVGATYDSQLNQKEAGRVVDFIVDHIQKRPDQSLGVVAVNIRQRDLIAELLEERTREMKEAIDFRHKWEKAGMSLFVKNLENVQGDERDAIIISTTYGPPPGGTKPHQNFGPISQQGGWRRLNVLFTRARMSVLLVTSLRDSDIVVGPGTPEGTKALRDYLTYAATGRLQNDPGTVTGEEAGSEFEVSVMRALQDLGYDCEPQVGVAGFRIDLGVRHPDYPHLFLAGIECDGASYHSGITVRDRDRIRQEILETLGWKGRLWRIWSTEWFRNPKVELRKLASFLEELKRVEVDAGLLQMTADDAASSEDDVAHTPAEEAAAREVAKVLITETGALEVEVGDNVTYRILSSNEPDREHNVLIVRGHADPASGMISENAPLSLALLGASIGDQSALSIAGQPIKTLEIVRITKPSGG